MNKRDMLRPKLVDPRGVLHERMTATSPGYGRFWPDDDLAPFVEHLWTVAWDLETPAVSEVLSHPSVQLVVERDASAVAGVFTGRFVRRLEGRGRVLGVKFLPGGFRPFCAGPVSELTDRRRPLAEVFGAAARRPRGARARGAGPRGGLRGASRTSCAPAARSPSEAIGLVGAHRRARGDRPRESPASPSWSRAFGLGPRQLQRLFDEYVGVRPKWVIQRYRLHEAAERIAASPEHDWAELALELGYADQAHFVRDFRRFVGSTPAAYARSFARESGDALLRDGALNRGPSGSGRRLGAAKHHGIHRAVVTEAAVGVTPEIEEPEPEGPEDAGEAPKRSMPSKRVSGRPSSRTDVEAEKALADGGPESRGRDSKVDRRDEEQGGGADG